MTVRLLLTAFCWCVISITALQAQELHPRLRSGELKLLTVTLDTAEGEEILDQAGEPQVLSGDQRHVFASLLRVQLTVIEK